MIYDFVYVQAGMVGCYFCKEKVHKLLHKGGKKSFYGLTWNKNKNIFVSKGCSVYKLNKDYNFNENVVYCTEGGQIIHQIVCFENLLYVADTCKNRIVKVDLFTGEKFFFDIEGQSGSDFNHVNSVFFCDVDGFLYICCHNHSEDSFVIVVNENMKVVEKIEKIGLQSHNVYVEGDILYSLSSKTKEIIKYNLKNSQRDKIDLAAYSKQLGDHIFLRGLARGEKNFLVGATSASVKKEHRGDCNIVAEFDDKFNLTDLLELPISNELREIRIVNDVDYSHNNVVFNLSSTSEGLVDCEAQD